MADIDGVNGKQYWCVVLCHAAWGLHSQQIVCFGCGGVGREINPICSGVEKHFMAYLQVVTGWIN